MQLPKEPSEEPEWIDLTGQTIKDFLLVRKLGSGAMADVYLANQKSLKRQVAFKILKKKHSSDPRYIKRFHKEAQAAASLAHSNIIQIFEVGEADGHHFIVQEYVRGQNMKQYLQRHGAMNPLLAINVLKQAVAALQKASEFGIVHRDIKPENIMVSSTGEIKVADFGLARLIEDSEATQLTQVGVAMGTPLYMSPEQIEARDVDSRSDIYSLGITAYQMLAGETPFVGETAISVAVQHLNSSPADLTLCRPDIPKNLCDVVHRMMAKDPKDRFQSASELQTTLRKIEIDNENKDWSPSFDQVSLQEAQAIYTQQRLESAQRAKQNLDPTKLAWLRPALGWLAFVLALFAIGYLLPGLVAQMNSGPEVAKSTESTDSDIRDRFQKALWANTIESWTQFEQEFSAKSVTDRDQTRLLHIAKLKSANLLLAQESNEEAQAIYTKLLTIDANDFPKVAASAKAGKMLASFRISGQTPPQSELNEVVASLHDIDGMLIEQLEKLTNRIANSEKDL